MSSPSAEAQGNRIVLQFESLDDALKLFSPWKGAGPRVQAASQIHQALEAAGLTVELRVKGRPVAQLGTCELRGPLLALLQPAI